MRGVKTYAPRVYTSQPDKVNWKKKHFELNKIENSIMEF